MQQLRVLGIYGLLLVALVYAAIKAYVYFSVKDGLDQAVATAQPFADVSYRSVGSDIRGGITVEGIEIRSGKMPVPVRVESLKLEGPGLGFLMDAAAGFEDRRAPSWMQLSLRRLNLPDIEALLPFQMKPASAGITVAKDDCSLAGLMQRFAASRMDIYPLLIDMEMGYRMDTATGAGSLALDYSIDRGESLSMQASMSELPQPQAVMMGASPRLDRLTISMQPPQEVVTKSVGECAAKQGLSPTVYVKSLFSGSEQNVGQALGYLPGPGLREALIQLLLDPQELWVSLGPIDEFSAFSGQQIDPRRLIREWGLQLKVNGQAVQDLSFEPYVPGDSAAVGETAYGTSAVQSGAGSSSQARRPMARFIETPVTELPGFIGRRVRLQASGHARPHTGHLISVEDEEVVVEKRLLQGKMSVHVPFEDIQGVEVLRLP